MEDLKVMIKAILENILGLDEEFSNEANIYDELGADSVVGFELMSKLQRQFKITIPPGDIPKLSSVDTIASYIKSKL